MARSSRFSPGRSSYWQRSQEPLQALVFLLPLILLYEFGVVRFDGTRDIVARHRLQGFFELLGVGGVHMPALAVVATLLGWHLARRDPWQFKLQRYVFMLFESVVLALPLLMFAQVLFREPMAGAAQWLAGAVETRPIGFADEVLLSIGAGIYEELLFRLMAIALLHLVLYDVLALPQAWAGALAVGISSLLFAGYHFLGANPFDMGKFLFYAAAGVYLATVYLWRGFGIAAGSHAMYDIFIAVITARLQAAGG